MCMIVYVHNNLCIHESLLLSTEIDLKHGGKNLVWYYYLCYGI